MSADLEWITTAMKNVQEKATTVPAPVRTHLEALLKGKLSQRPIPPVELSNIAMQLIEDMVDHPSVSKEPK